MSKKKVDGFVKWEMELFRNECNFTPDESMFFDLRNEGEGMTLEEISGQMGYGMTKISDLSEAVTDKMKRVFPLKEAYLKKYCEKYGE